MLFPELALTGYPPEDLLLRAHFLADARSALEDLAREVTGTTAIVGFPELAGDRVYNAAAVLADGTVQTVYRKIHLPNYGVFDERRYFTAGSSGATIEVAGHRVGVTVCEDLWQPGPPATDEAADGASLLINISASPYHAGKGTERERLFAERAVELESTSRSARSSAVRTSSSSTDIPSSWIRPVPRSPARFSSARTCSSATSPPRPRTTPTTNRLRAAAAPVEAEVYAALTLGLHDYVDKNGF